MTKTIMDTLKKYKFVALILLVGLVLMLLPSGDSGDVSERESSGTTYSLEETERRLEALLKDVQGVGQVNVMLTLKSSSALELAEDSSTSLRDSETKRERDVVTVSRGGGEEVVVTQERYPTYQGAVVVCEGGGNSAVRLSVIEAVSVLTGLGSDKITVVQWK